MKTRTQPLIAAGLLLATAVAGCATEDRNVDYSQLPPGSTAPPVDPEPRPEPEPEPEVVSHTTHWTQTIADDALRIRDTKIDAYFSKEVVIVGELDGAIDLGGGMLDGEGDMVIASLSLDGEHLWSKQLGGSGVVRVAAVDTDGKGQLVVVGSFEGTVDLGGGLLSSAGGSDIFVAAYDHLSGGHLWSKRLGDGANQSALDVDFAGKTIVLAGRFGGEIDFGKPAGEDASNIVISGGGNDLFVATMDASGLEPQLLWARGYGGAVSEVALADTEMGVGIAVAGTFDGALDFSGGEGNGQVLQGDHDIFVAMMDLGGQTLFSHRLGGESPDWCSSVVIDESTGDVVLGGLLTVDDDGQPVLASEQVFVDRYNKGGKRQWRQRAKVENNAGQTAKVTHLLITPQADVVALGPFAGELDFGGPVLKTPGTDTFVALLSDSGEHLYSGKLDRQNARTTAATARAGSRLLIAGHGDPYSEDDEGFLTYLELPSAADAE